MIHCLIIAFSLQKERFGDNVEFFQLVVSVAILFAILAMLHKGFREKTTYLGILQKFKSQDDVTTVLPLPIHSATCDHDWETLAEHKLEMPHEKKMVLVLSCRHCGAIDKTVQVTSPEPPPAPAVPCCHDWQNLTEQVLELPHEKKVVLVLSCRKCGMLDKTKETTTPVPKGKEDCRHRWDKQKSVTLDSAYEQMLRSISIKQSYGKVKVDTDKKINLDLNKAPAWIFKKTYVCEWVCTQCGEVHTTVASNFDSSEEDFGEKAS